MEIGLCAHGPNAWPAGVIDNINTPARAYTPKREDGSIAKGRLCPPRGISDLSSHESKSSQKGPLDCNSLKRTPMKIGFGGDMLSLMMAPGDVLFARGVRTRNAADESPSALGLPGFGCMTRPGTVGDWTDHVLLVAGPPWGVWRNSPEAADLKDVWLAVSAVNQGAEVWRVDTIDSSVRGLHIAESLLYVDRATGQLMLVGEIDPEDGELYVSERPEPVELWQSPAELRAQIHLDFVEEVLRDMKAGEADWSPSSAACAIIESSEIAVFDDHHTLDDVQACWKQDPICTGAVIGFWQRYLCKLAEACSPRGSAECAERAMALILRWMPIRCDRALPGDLAGSMQSADWIFVPQIPRIFWPVLLPGQHRLPISVAAASAPSRIVQAVKRAGVQPEVPRESLDNLELLRVADDDLPESVASERSHASERSREGPLEQFLPHTNQELQDNPTCQGPQAAEIASDNEVVLPTCQCRPPLPPRDWIPNNDYSLPPCDPTPLVLECSLRTRPGSNALRGIVAL